MIVVLAFPLITIGVARGNMKKKKTKNQEISMNGN